MKSTKERKDNIGAGATKGMSESSADIGDGRDFGALSSVGTPIHKNNS